MEINKINISATFGGRLDPHQFHPERMDMIRHIYSSGEWCKLKDVVDNVKIITTSLTNEDTYIGLENIASNTGEYLITSDKSSISSAAVFNAGDILFPKLRPYLNKIHRATFSGKCSTEFHVFAAKNIDADLLTILLRSNMVVAQTKHLMTGNTLPRLQTSDIANLIVPFPTAEVQKKIVDLYTKAQTEKQGKEQQAKELLKSIDTYLLDQLNIVLPKEQKRQLAFEVKLSDILGKRLNPLSYNDKTLKIKELIDASKLKKKTINEMLVASIAGDWGIGENEETGDDYTKCLVIRATEFDKKYNLKLDNSRVKYRKIKNSKLHKMDVQEDDILIEKSGGSPEQPVGRVAIITKEILDHHTLGYSNFIHKIRIDKKEINPRYVYHFLSTMYRVGTTESMQSQTNGIRNLVMNSFLKQQILIPDNQNEIVNYIEAMYIKAASLEEEAMTIINQAKAKIEKIILG